MENRITTKVICVTVLFEDSDTLSVNKLKEVFDLHNKYRWEVNVGVLKNACLKRTNIPQSGYGKFYISVSNNTIEQYSNFETFEKIVNKQVEEIINDLKDILGADIEYYIDRLGC